MDDRSAELAATLDRLGASFIERTLSEISNARTLCGELVGGNVTAPARALERWAHRIHGGGASFGLDTVSAHGDRIERLAASLASQPGKVVHGVMLEVRLELDRLESELRARSASR